MQTSDLDNASILAALLESLPCGVLAFDASADLNFASAPVASLLGVDLQHLHELGNFEAIVAALAPRFTEAESIADRWRQHFRSGEGNWDELELVAPGRKILERMGRPILDSAGRKIGWIEIFREVTVQRLMERKLLQNERMVALGQLVSSVAHEIRNPLTSIYGYAQLLVWRRAAAGATKEVQFILQEAERAGGIVRKLLLFARGAKVERSAVNLNETIQRTTALRTYELSLSGIRLHLNLDPDLPPILADPAQLQQVVLNLVTNAEQALESRHGRGRIWLRTRRLSEERVALEVTDDGPGIAPELIPHIFDPFFTTKPPGAGTGIGLSIVRGIMREYGGEVSVHSHPGQGAMFTLAFPAASAIGIEALPPSDWRLSSPPPLHHPPSGVIRRQRVLIVEDEPTVAHLIADVLAEEGCSVEAVLDSRAGLDLLQHRSYDLLICDLQLPHLDGRDIYRELLRMGNPLAHRLVFVTGDMLLPSTIEFLESCNVPCLPKPFLVEELKDIVRGALGGSPVTAAAEARQGGG